MNSAWQVVRKETQDGHTVEMRYGEFGKGKAKLCKWEIYRNGTKAGYAVNSRDAETNFALVMSGYVLNIPTGTYEKVI